MSSLKIILHKMFAEDAHVMSFFQSYERTMALNNIPEIAWARYLPVCLNVKATNVYSRLTLEQCKSYDAVKAEILSMFRLNARAYLDKFRTIAQTGNESYKLFLNRLQEYQRYYLEARKLKTVEEVLNDALANQFLLTLQPDVKAWVESRQPKSSIECATLADL